MDFMHTEFGSSNFASFDYQPLNIIAVDLIEYQISYKPLPHGWDCILKLVLCRVSSWCIVVSPYSFSCWQGLLTD